MNTVKKFVLLPADQFLRLKRRETSDIDQIMDMDLPKDLKVRLATSITNSKNQDQQLKSDLEEETNKPIAHPLNDNMLNYPKTEVVEEQQNPQPEEEKPPLNEIKKEREKEFEIALRSIPSLISANGKILNKSGKTIKNSNVHQIITFLLNPRARTKPAGAVRVVKVVKENAPHLFKLFLNKKVKKNIKLSWENL